MGPILVFDKSFLESLNPDEAVWLDHFFLTNITPLFLIETLADLEKEVRKGRTPEQVVGSLAYKTPDMNAKPSVHHAKILASELGGAMSIDMSQGRIIIPGGKRTVLEGERGVVFQQSPEEESFVRWQRGEFLDIERQSAKSWRAALALIDPSAQRTMFAELVPKGISNLAEVKQHTDALIDQADRETSLVYGLSLLRVAAEAQRMVLERWRGLGSPPLLEFAPYFRHVYGVELFFYVGLAARLISERRTNHIDLAYLHYLPFCMVFTSNDALHASTTPRFLRVNQTFVHGSELKAGLAALDRHYTALPEEVKVRGPLEFAAWPPTEGSFLVSELWDTHMRKDWRQIATRPPVPRNTEADTKLVAHLRAKWEAPEAPPAVQPTTSDDADYLIVTQNVRMRKGKWNRFPPEVTPDP